MGKGLDASKIRGRSASQKRLPSQSLLGKRKRDATLDIEEDRAASAARSKSRMKGLPSEDVAQKVEKVRRKRMKLMEKYGKKGEADRHIPDWKPKHLFTGKRGIGKTDRR